MKSRFTNSGLTVALLAIIGLAVSGCSMNFNMVDGYMFTNTGESAKSTELGEISEGITAIDVVNKFGNVKIELADGEPGWRWESKVWADTRELADLLIDELVLDVQTSGQTQTWRILLPEPSPDINGIESNLTLLLPAEISAKLYNSHGDISVANIYGAVELKNLHGNVTLSELTGNVDAKNSHGDLTASLFGESAIEVSHGDIVATQHSGSIKTKNRHGSTQLNSSGEYVTIDSSHGKVELSILSDNFRLIDIGSSHGSVNVALPADSHPQIDMKASHGHTSSEVESKKTSTQKIKLRSNHGNIRVTKIAQAEAVLSP